MRFAPRNERGFTVIELMMALAVIAILAAAAMPAFGRLIQSGHAQAARSALIASLNTARMSAASKVANVGVCPSSDQQYCDRTTQWQGGWLTFVDLDRNGVRDDGEDILQAVTAAEGVAILTTAGRARIAYRPDGSSAGSNVTFTICDRRGPAQATAIVVNNAGRVRSGVPTASAAASCAALLRESAPGA